MSQRRVTLPYPPTVNLYWRMGGGHMHISDKGRAYKQRVGLLALSQGMRPLTGPVKLTLDLYRPRKCGDLDNTLKAILDALKGVAFADDSQVEHIDARRYDDKDNPRAEVEVSAADT